jgi:DDE superfamily endonuclease
VTAAQLRGVVERLAAAGHWKDGDPRIIIAMDAGYNATRLAWLLAGLPVVLVARVRSDRVYYGPPPAGPRAPGRAPRHGAPVRCGDPATWDGAQVSLAADSPRYGPLSVTGWQRAHQKLTRQSGGWERWHGELPVIEGTLIRLQVEHLPGDRSPEPLWLWSSRAGADPAAVDRTWQAFLRRFDIEHTFRFLKQVLGWTRPRLRDPAAADRWTWLILACYAQLWLARGLAEDLRLPWQRPAPPGRLTPARVRRGFRNIRQALPDLASAPKPGKPGPGRPPGSKNRRPATRHDVGKTVKRDEPKKKPAGRRVK